MKTPDTEKYFDILNKEMIDYLLRRSAARVWFIMPDTAVERIKRLVWDNHHKPSSCFKVIGIYDNLKNPPSGITRTDKEKTREFEEIVRLYGTLPRLDFDHAERIDKHLASLSSSNHSNNIFILTPKLYGVGMDVLFKVIFGFLYPYDSEIRCFAYNNIKETGILKELLPIKKLHAAAYYWSDDQNINVLPYGGYKDTTTSSTPRDIFKADLMELIVSMAVRYFVATCYANRKE